MDIIYDNKTVEKQCTNYTAAQKKLNKQVAEKLHSAINFIDNSTCLMDIKNMPMYRLHALRGDRKGSYAIDLGKRLGYRLIIVPLDNSKNRWDTTDENKIFKSTKIILALEVTNHYE
ncbi:MAG: type II toxin-antitoxin system RelE/ParE family toxin [Romboutsia sp.]